MSARPIAVPHQPYRSKIRRSETCGNDRGENAAVTLADGPSPIVITSPSNYLTALKPDDDQRRNRGADCLGKSDQRIRTRLKGRPSRLGEDRHRGKKRCHQHQARGESAAEADFN